MSSGPRHLVSIRTAAALLLGLGLGLLTGRLTGAGAVDYGVLAHRDALAATEPHRDTGAVRPEDRVCGPDPFFWENSLCFDQTAQEQALRELERVLVRESGILAGRLGKLRTGQEALRERFPPFPQAYMPIVPMGDEIVANGVPMNLAFFEAKADAPRILEYYATHFSSRGWSWSGVKENYQVIPHPAISAIDLEERVQMTVMVLEDREEGYSTVFLGLADMLPEAQRPLEDVGDLPVFPGSGPVALRSFDLEASGLTVTFTVAEPNETVVSFYRERMRELGYSEHEPAPAVTDELGATIQTLRFASDHGRWTLALTSYDGETGVTAVNSIQEVRQ
ncbi:MAG: hypothetical protein ACOX6T_09730 [Myxococcales bacterium]|jgi:hypothetical protein